MPSSKRYHRPRGNPMANRGGLGAAGAAAATKPAHGRGAVPASEKAQVHAAPANSGVASRSPGELRRYPGRRGHSVVDMLSTAVPHIMIGQLVFQSYSYPRY